MKKPILIWILCLFWSINFAIARGWCFLSGTHINTPSGTRDIQELTGGDHIISYNMQTHKQESSTISYIDIVQREGYYLINNILKVTAEHPFYTKENNKLLIKKTEELKPWDILINDTNTNIMISWIVYYTGTITAYNIINVEPNNNYYANSILVHNKWWGGGWGWGWWGHSSSSNSSQQGPCYITSNSAYNTQACIKQRTEDDNRFFRTLWGLLIIVILMRLKDNLLRIILWPKTIYHVITNKKFSEDYNLISFVQTKIPQFQNKYSLWYCKDDQIWRQKKSKNNLDEKLYTQYISTTLLHTWAKKIFLDYQKDRTDKNRKNMETYCSELFINKQKKIFINAFKEWWDITYDVHIDNIVPIKMISQKIHDEELKIIRIQFNASMINFAVNTWGTITTGTDQRQSFTEYRDLHINSNQKLILRNIRQNA